MVKDVTDVSRAVGGLRGSGEFEVVEVFEAIEALHAFKLAYSQHVEWSGGTETGCRVVPSTMTISSLTSRGSVRAPVESYCGIDQRQNVQAQ